MFFRIFFHHYHSKRPNTPVFFVFGLWKTQKNKSPRNIKQKHLFEAIPKTMCQHFCFCLVSALILFSRQLHVLHFAIALSFANLLHKPWLSARAEQRFLTKWIPFWGSGSEHTSNQKSRHQKSGWNGCPYTKRGAVSDFFQDNPPPFCCRSWPWPFGMNLQGNTIHRHIPNKPRFGDFINKLDG